MANRVTLTIAALLAVTLLAQPALAVSNVATTSIDAAGISIAPNVSHDGMTVRLSGPEGIVEEWVFGAGESATIFSSELEDGFYSWEATLAPRLDSATRRNLQDAREQGYDISRELRAQGKLPAEPQVISGSFYVKGGALVVDREEQIAPPSSSSALEAATGQAIGGLDNTSAAAQVFATDLIVQGSTCVGIDCTSSENFSFDTLRLKENNLRIKFDDTSGSASFPNNDWQLTANDSGNGGANKFSIDDITNSKTPFTVEANSPNNTLYVDSAGRIGVKTSTPVVDVHIVEGNTPTLRLEQDGSDGFGSQTWDIAGNETNFFIRDTTNGSKLPFKIKPGAPDNSIFIAADGDVAFGSQSVTANADLDLVGSSTLSGLLVRTSGNPTETSISMAATSNAGFIGTQTDDILVFNVNAAEAMRIDTDGQVGIGCNSFTAGVDLSVGSTADGSGQACTVSPVSTLVAGTGWTHTSSRTFKENFQQIPTDGILEKISAIDVYNYDFINGPKDVVGLIAEDFHQVFENGSEKMINSQQVQMALWLAVKELTASNAELKTKLEALEAAAAQ